MKKIAPCKLAVHMNHGSAAIKCLNVVLWSKYTMEECTNPTLDITIFVYLYCALCSMEEVILYRKFRFRSCFVLHMTLHNDPHEIWNVIIMREWYKQTFRKFQPWPSQVSMEHYCVVYFDCTQYCIRSAAAQNFRRSGTHDMSSIPAST